MRTLIKAAVRLVIILMFFHLFLYIGNSLAMLIDFFTVNQFTIFNNHYYYLAVPVIVFVIGVLILWYLWLNTDWLAEFIAEDIDEHEIVIKTSNLDLIKVVFRIMGMYLIVTQIPTIVGLSVSHVILEKYTSGIVTSLVGEIKQWIITVGTVLIGLWLLFGGKGIVEMIDRQSDNNQIGDEDTVDGQSQQQ
jgi:hypothetical protein